MQLAFAYACLSVMYRCVRGLSTLKLATVLTDKYAGVAELMLQRVRSMVCHNGPQLAGYCHKSGSALHLMVSEVRPNMGGPIIILILQGLLY